MKRMLYLLAMTTLALLVLAACTDPISSPGETSVPGSEASSGTTQPSSEATTASTSEASAPLTGNYGEFREIEVGEDTRVVVFGSDEVSFQVISTLIIRNQNALLVDTKFNKTDAREIIDYINDSGLNLTQIFISHGDPDYYFGLEEFRAAFPSAAVSTTPSVAEHIEATVAGKIEVWASALGDEVPTNFVMPENLIDTSFDFEGLNIEIFGSDPIRITLYSPELNMLFGGANITNGNHLFLADMSTDEDRASWADNLAELRGLNAAIVIPGHTDLATETFDTSAIDFSINYLQAASEVLVNSTTSEEFITGMEARFPSLRSREVLVLSGGVLTGEMEWRRYADN